MSLIRWNPYDPFLDLRREMAKFTQSGQFSPEVDVYEEESDIVVQIALAGINPKNVQLNIEDSILHIEGHAVKEREVDESHYYRKEVRSGSFNRLVPLPAPVHEDKATAEFDNGLLTVRVPKKEQQKSKPISINIKE